MATQPSADGKRTTPRLGRGLQSLLNSPVRLTEPSEALGHEPASQATQSPLRRLGLSTIVPSRFQPRRTIDEASLRSLSESIRASGVMQPVLVRPIVHTTNDSTNESFELIAGERRWRAARLAGLSDIPAIVVLLSDEESAAWGIVENVQREDLNAMDRAYGLKSLVERFGLTHAEIGERIGVDRSTVANLIRLVDLSPEIQRFVQDGSLSAGHARALLVVNDQPARLALAQRAATHGWSVRKLEEQAKTAAHAGLSATQAAAVGKGAGLLAVDAAAAARREAAIRDIERRLAEHLGTRVRIRTDPSGKKGSLSVEFYDLDQFDGLLARIGLRPE